MNSARKSVAGLPVDVVDELESSQLVSRLPIVRAGGPLVPDAVVVGAQVVTTLITFAQAPETIEYLSAALARWRRRSKVETVTLDVRGPRGRVKLELRPDTKPRDIARVLRLLEAASADDA